HREGGLFGEGKEGMLRHFQGMCCQACAKLEHPPSEPSKRPTGPMNSPTASGKWLTDTEKSLTNTGKSLTNVGSPIPHAGARSIRRERGADGDGDLLPPRRRVVDAVGLDLGRVRLGDLEDAGA